MNFSPQKNFSELKTREVPRDLFGKIMVRISLKQKQRAMREFIASSLVFIASIGVFIPVLGAVHGAMIRSGSYEYLSLVFSNFSDVMSSWQDFVFSFLESLPILGIAGFLITLFLLLASLRYISRDAKILFYHHF